MIDEVIHEDQMHMTLPNMNNDTWRRLKVKALIH